jgi:hypothetical protein
MATVEGTAIRPLQHVQRVDVAGRPLGQEHGAEHLVQRHGKGAPGRGEALVLDEARTRLGADDPQTAAAIPLR